MKEIIIRPALNGYICQVGCATVVFESVAKLIYELEKYLYQPKETEVRFLRSAKNKLVINNENIGPAGASIEAGQIRRVF